MEAARVQSAINSMVECVVCMDIYQDPRILPCGHTFCMKCLLEMSNKRMIDHRVGITREEDEEMCALCKQPWKIPINGINNVAKNFVVEQIISSLPAISKCALSEKGNDHGKVEYYCLTCMEPLCISCAKIHINYDEQLLQTHNLKKITEVDEKEIKLQQAKDSNMEDIEKSLKQLKSSAEIFQNKLVEDKKIIEEAEEECKNVLQSLQDFTRGEKDKLQAAYDKANKEIDKQEAELIKTVNSFCVEKVNKITIAMEKLKTVLKKQQQLIIEHEKLMRAFSSRKSKNKLLRKVAEMTKESDKIPLECNDNHKFCDYFFIEQWKNRMANAIQNVEHYLATAINIEGKQAFGSFYPPGPGYAIGQTAMQQSYQTSSHIQDRTIPRWTSTGIGSMYSPHHPFGQFMVKQPPQKYDIQRVPIPVMTRPATQLASMMFGTVRSPFPRWRSTQYPSMPVAAPGAVHAPQPAVTIQSQEPLTASMLAAAPLYEQKQMLGERLLPLIQGMYPGLAGKITGMMLEIDNAELLHMLESTDALRLKVEEAVTVLQAHQSMQLAAKE